MLEIKIKYNLRWFSTMKRFAILTMFVVAIFSIMAGCSSNKSASKDDKTLIIGVDDTFAPMGFRDKNNKL